MFIKPHACNEKVQALVAEKLAGFGITIKGEGLLEATEIDDKKLIDVHYGAIANRAVMTPVAELNVPPPAQEKYEAAFGLSWASALEQGLVLNAVSRGGGIAILDMRQPRTASAATNFAATTPHAHLNSIADRRSRAAKSGWCGARDGVAQADERRRPH